MLHAFITLYRDEIIDSCRQKAAARCTQPRSNLETDHGVPLFLDQLVAVLLAGQLLVAPASRAADPVTVGASTTGDICQSITELGIKTNTPFNTEDFGTLNRCLDNAIAAAVKMYTSQSEKGIIQRAREHPSEQMVFIIHELRNLVSTAVAAFDVLTTGEVGVPGSTGAVLRRSLAGLRDLAAYSLTFVPSTQTATSRRRILVCEFVAQVAASARAGIKRKARLKVMPIQKGLAISADREVLGAALGNLLLNALTFTQPGSIVTLQVGASADRVLIEVHDECGGIPDTQLSELFRPAESPEADQNRRAGLAFSRWGVEMNGGRLDARNLPGKGCIFTLDLPRSADLFLPELQSKVIGQRTAPTRSSSGTSGWAAVAFLTWTS